MTEATHGCPFFGRSYIRNEGVLVELDSDHCALEENAYAPCRLHVQGKPPDWRRCEFAQRPGNRARAGWVKLLRRQDGGWTEVAIHAGEAG